jgi:hypothetical protein
VTRDETSVRELSDIIVMN